MLCTTFVWRPFDVRDLSVRPMTNVPPTREHDNACKHHIRGMGQVVVSEHDDDTDGTGLLVVLSGPL